MNLLKLVLLGWIIMYVWAMYDMQPFSLAHYWQTLNQPESSGQVIVEEMKYERFSRTRFNYKLTLKGQDNAPSLHFDKEVSSSLGSDTDSTLLDYGKVWKILEQTNINDTVSVKWITRTNKQPIFTSINGQANIGFFTSKKGVDLAFIMIGIIFISFLCLSAIYLFSREILRQ